MTMEHVERILSSVENIERLGTSANISLRRMPKYYVRNEFNQNPYELYDENEFKRRYRFSKNTVLNIIYPFIAGNLSRLSNRGLPISPEIQLLIALRFYATGCFQIVCADLINISQSTTCLIINRISKELCKLLPKYINFPRGQEMQKVKRKFEEMGRSSSHHGLNNIIGAIDCTHIKIVRPRGLHHSEAFRNRKGFFSINLQAIVGPNMEIFNIVARWPGSSHDSRIFRNSQAYTQLLSGDLQGILVGDSGYPSLPFMLTPLLQATTRAENNYNNAQIRTRNVVERFFGVWKKKFNCLQTGLRCKLINSCSIIIACAVLHNIGVQSEDSYDDNEGQVEEPISEGLVPLSNVSSPEGLAFRQAVIAQFNY